MSTATTTITAPPVENVSNVALKGDPGKIRNTSIHIPHDPTYKYDHLVPRSDPSLNNGPPLEPFEHYDRGHRVQDPLTNPLEHLLGKAQYIENLTPAIGTEVKGIQLSQLDEKAKDELAVYVARRKVVVFRDQDFADQSNEFFLNWGNSFGRHHIHQTSGHPEGIPELHLVYRDKNSSYDSPELDNKLNTLSLHSDITFERQPAGTTTFFALSVPASGGGDTLFVNTAEAYNRLSEPFRKRLEGLEAEHSGVEQIEASRRRGGITRREPVKNIHPVIRTHPVTGERSIFVNPGFTRRIVGLKNEESDALLKFLYEHIAKGIDFHTRVKYYNGTVVIWDNRVTQHSAIVDYNSNEKRHNARITPQAEKPFFR